MGFSEAEFYRLLPAAIGKYRMEREGKVSRISHPTKQQELIVKVLSLGERRLGMIRIPRVEVTFQFIGFHPDERSRFMTYFDYRYQRGGG